MWINHFRELMIKQYDNLSAMIEDTGLSRNALNKLWHRDKRDMTTIKLETLQKVCDALQVKLSDLLEYVPDESGKEGKGTKI